MCIKKSLMWLCAAEMLLTCGCVSNKITMNPPVTAVIIPDANTTAYKIEKVKVSTAPYALPLKWGNETFSDRFIRMAHERYPALFNNSPSALPILVRINVNQEVHSTESFAVYLCTLCIVGGILPSVPWSTEWQVDIGVEDVYGTTMRASKVRAEHRGWWSVLTPLGWIEVPGNSDIPAVDSTMFTSGPGIIPAEYKTYILQSMVDLLAGDLLNQNPAQRTKSAQAPISTPLPGKAPGLLPLPAETVAPF
ncbi:MAG: hypothetical protein PHP93_03145 [Kiritimatiellales bacterium]|nr:hypothetical protein [Kiritimatiellales bacterium]